MHDVNGWIYIRKRRFLFRFISIRTFESWWLAVLIIWSLKCTYRWTAPRGTIFITFPRRIGCVQARHHQNYTLKKWTQAHPNVMHFSMHFRYLFHLNSYETETLRQQCFRPVFLFTNTNFIHHIQEKTMMT